MKEGVFTTFIFAIINISSIIAEDSLCNKNVLIKDYLNKLPKEICIPKNYIISEIFDSTDINSDGLKDFIFSWQKNNLNDGDTIFITIYKKINSYSFTYFKTLSNIYPIYFNSYDRDYEIKNKTQIETMNKYNWMNPFVDFSFLLDKLTLKITCSTGEGFIFHYKYQNEKENWYLIKLEKWIDLLEDTKITELEIPEKEESIDDFSYFKYMY